MRPDFAAASRLPAYRALAVTVVTLALAYGVWYAYSVFLVALLREFGWKSIIDMGDISNARATEQLLPIWIRLFGMYGNPTFNFHIVRA